MGGRQVQEMSEERTYPLIIGTEFVADIPLGWKVVIFAPAEMLIAVSIDHPPRMIELSKAGETPFAKWPEWQV